MKDVDKLINLFWSLVWAVMLALGVIGIFHKWAVIVEAILAAVMLVVFVKEYIRIARMK